MFKEQQPIYQDYKNTIYNKIATDNLEKYWLKKERYSMPPRLIMIN